MRGQEIEQALSSGDVVQVCKALRFLAGPRSGPVYPRRRVLALLGPENPERVRENALVLLLRRGQHPLEHRRILDLLLLAPEGLFGTLIEHVTRDAFPSAAEDCLFWCWNKRRSQADRRTMLRVATSLPGPAVRRFVNRSKVLHEANQVLVSAALSLLASTGAPNVEPLFEQALEHRNPRFRSIALEHLAPAWTPEMRRQRLLPMRQDPNHRVRSTAAVLSFEDDALGCLETLGAMTRASNPLARAAAAWGLGEIAPRYPECRPMLHQLRRDRDARVAERARLSLRAA